MNQQNTLEHSGHFRLLSINQHVHQIQVPPKHN